MFDWLKKLLSGDSSALPPDAKVERDAQGRVVRVQHTMSAAHPEGQAQTQPAAPALPVLEIAEHSKPALAEAARWLHGQNIHAAQYWGIGLEEHFTFDQGDGLLRLQFAGGRELALPSQLLGSFDARNGSFMWGWHNPSFLEPLKAAAETARKAGAELGEPGFAEPVQKVSFDTLTPLIAFAARAAGCDGVYSAYLGGGTTVFIGYALPHGQAPLTLPDAASIAQVQARVTQHDADMMAQDAAYHEQEAQGEDDGLLDRILAAKMQVWQRDWASDDSYWHPCSAGWPSGHDRSRADAQFFAAHPDGGVLDCRIGPSVKKTVYHLHVVEGEYKITGQLLDWGDGFVWPVM